MVQFLNKDITCFLLIKVSAGSQHSLVLTGSGQVYGWGNNKQGQSNPFETLAVVLQPTRLQLPRDETARDVLAQMERSLVLCDTGNIYYTGPKGKIR